MCHPQQHWTTLILGHFLVLQWHLVGGRVVFDKWLRGERTENSCNSEWKQFSSPRNIMYLSFAFCASLSVDFWHLFFQLYWQVKDGVIFCCCKNTFSYPSIKHNNHEVGGEEGCSNILNSQVILVQFWLINSDSAQQHINQWTEFCAVWMTNDRHKKCLGNLFEKVHKE